MKLGLLPLVVAASLTLSACTILPGSATLSSKGLLDTTPATVVTQPTVPAHTGDATLPIPEPEPPKPAEIKWYPRGIGLPLTTDDPAGKEKKVVMLTFDDGPADTGSTARILDTLKEHNIKAMFFITGYGAKHMDLVERIHREGHPMGPHTMTHPNMSRLPIAQMRAEIEPLIATIEKVTGERPKYFRPPFGAYNQTLLDLLKEYNMELLNWTDGSLDWEGVKNGRKDPNKVIDDTMRQLHRGAIVLMHDTLQHTADALPELITRMKAEGYEFVVLR